MMMSSASLPVVVRLIFSFETNRTTGYYTTKRAHSLSISIRRSIALLALKYTAVRAVVYGYIT
jgi:hypothetical protein